MGISQNDLPYVELALENAVEELLELVLETGESTAKNNVAVDTGELKASIKWEKQSSTEGTLSAGEGIPDIRAYANEFGTSKMPAHPFMHPALQDMITEVEQADINLEDYI